MLLTPNEVDAMLRFPRGRSARLARRGLMDSVVLPDGSMRFRRDVVEQIVNGADRADQLAGTAERQRVMRGGRSVETAARGLGGRESR